MIHTLIFVSMLSASPASPMMTHQDYESEVVCQTRLRASVDGLRASVNGNAVGPAKVGAGQVTDEDGWTTLRTPVGRVVAKLRCVPYPAAPR